MKNPWKGKKIKKVDDSAVNSWVFYFTDGSSIRIDVERYGSGVFGMVGNITK